MQLIQFIIHRPFAFLHIYMVARLKASVSGHVSRQNGELEEVVIRCSFSSSRSFTSAGLVIRTNWQGVRFFTVSMSATSLFVLNGSGTSSPPTANAPKSSLAPKSGSVVWSLQLHSTSWTSDPRVWPGAVQSPSRTRQRGSKRPTRVLEGDRRRLADLRAWASLA